MGFVRILKERKGRDNNDGEGIIMIRGVCREEKE